jgi:transposase
LRKRKRKKKKRKKKRKRRKKKRRRKRKRKKKRNRNLHTLPHPTTDVENLYSLQVFQKYFFLVSIALSLQTMKTNMKSGNKYNLKTGQNTSRIYVK